MGALTLTLDDNLRLLDEPGFRQYFSAEKIREVGLPTAPQDNFRIFSDPQTGTLMLYPQNLRPDWLNTPAQVTSIIRLADSVIHPDDATNGTVFEEISFGNAANFYIYHSPIGFPGFPSAPGPPLPGAPPSLVGAPVGASIGPGLASIAEQSPTPVQTYSDPDTASGDVTDGRVILYTQDRQPVNAPFLFRWHHPNPKIGHQTRYIFYVGQLAIEIAGNTVVVYTDTSPSGDRSQFLRIWGKPMFGPADFAPSLFPGRYWTLPQVAETEAHDRTLLVIPYFRNRILLVASNGTAYSVVVRGEPHAAPGAVISGPVTEFYGFEITREDTLMVWCVTPAPGRFQVQKVYFAEGQAQINLPPVTIDYTPVDLPTVTLAADRDHNTNVTGVVSDPPGYTYPVNEFSRCPAPVTAATDQSRNYGLRLTLVGEATHRWSPFFYGMQFTAPTTFRNNPATPGAVIDTGVPTTNILRGMVAWGDRPGDGRLECEILDESPYALAPSYYRAGAAVRLTEDGVSLFTGWADPMEVEPLHEVARPRAVQVRALDRWKQLADTILRDQRDWTGVGHIEVVLSVAEQGGVDTSSPAAETPPLTPQYNTRLGGVEPTTPQTEKDARLLNPGWAPQGNDTAATFIKRIADNFSNWDVGFRADGAFYYLPKDWFTTTALRFFHSAEARTTAGGGFANNPLVRSPVQFTTIEPEGNVVLAIGGSDKDGTVLFSSLHVDWASIKNPLVVNYLGRRKVVVVTMPGVYTCQELNRIARVVFDQARKRRRMASFEGDYVPTLKQGQIIEIGTYGFYRLRGAKVDLERSNWHPATYEAELNERGYNLP